MIISFVVNPYLSLLPIMYVNYAKHNIVIILYTYSKDTKALHQSCL